MQYVFWMRFNGKSLEWPEECNALDQDAIRYEKCSQQARAYTVARELPYCYIPVLLVLSVVMSFVLYIYVEVPMRHVLRSNRTKIKHY